MKEFDKLKVGDIATIVVTKITMDKDGRTHYTLANHHLFENRMIGVGKEMDKMKGTCWNCGAKNVDINPYRDDPYYGLCFVCQSKRKDKDKKGNLAIALHGMRKND